MTVYLMCAKYELLQTIHKRAMLVKVTLTLTHEGFIHVEADKGFVLKFRHCMLHFLGKTFKQLSCILTWRITGNQF